MMNQRGFSLIEALAAMAIFSVGLMIAADLTTSGAKSVAYDKRMAQTVQIASSLLEELTVAYSADARLTAGTHTQYFNIFGQAVAAPDVYTATWIVTLDNPMVLIMRITLNVQWTGSGSTGVNFLTFRGSS